MKRIIGVDQANRKWLTGKTTRSQANAEDVAYNLVTLILLFATVFILLASASYAQQPDSIVGATIDNLMSAERAEFMVCCEHGEEFTEFDMD